MGWLDRFRGREREREDTEAVTASARAADQGSETPESADELDEVAHEHRDEQFFREPRKPPGTG